MPAQSTNLACPEKAACCLKPSRSYSERALETRGKWPPRMSGGAIHALQRYVAGETYWHRSLLGTVSDLGPIANTSHLHDLVVCRNPQLGVDRCAWPCGAHDNSVRAIKRESRCLRLFSELRLLRGARSHSAVACNSQCFVSNLTGTKNQSVKAHR